MGFSKVRFKAGKEVLVGLICTNGVAEATRILFIHGAGQATKERVQPLALRLLEYDLASFCFDFSGHGESTGQLEESSLQKRVTEAQAALSRFCSETPITLCASSMGGHIALELLKANPIQNLVLLSPAIYAQEALDVPFGDSFSRVIRQKNSWMRASVVDILGDFSGKLLILIGDQDRVIPKGVIDLLDERAASTVQKEILTVRGAGHRLLDFIYQHPLLLESITRKIIQYAT